MSKKYPGGIIRGTPVVPAGPYQDGAAPGTWTLDQATNYIKQGIWPLAGNVNPNAFIENLFQTWLYTGNGSSQTITNGIDLSTYGGLVWFKCRTLASNNRLTDTVRGAGNSLISNSTLPNQTSTGSGEVSSFTSTGYTTNLSGFNSTDTYASWTFRKQAKFFDVVTFTGDGSASLAVNHNLGSVPGCVIVKRTDSGGGWFVWHRATSGTPNNDYIRLEQTSAVASATNAWSGNAFTSTQFFVSNNLSTNVGGATYVAYLFAHNAGGFGLTGTDNVISCGSYTEGASATTVTLGYEPQWLLVKRSSGTSGWYLIDNMRGFDYSDTKYLEANTSAAEVSVGASYFKPTATGFIAEPAFFGNGSSIIYIAIRRGPMKTPTSGTSVYESTTSPASGSPGFTAGFPVDFAWLKRPAFTGSNFWGSRLTGAAYLDTTDTAAEQASGNWTWDYQSGWFATGLGSTYRSWMIRRAPGFFDVVCYTGTGSATTQTHNLGVVPELMIVKSRSSAESYWGVYTSTTGNNKFLGLNVTDAATTNSSFWNNTTPTASVFSIGTIGSVNRSGETYVAYLFASCPGVSKVGSYTGTGATQTINCGFTSGARFVLIKATSTTGDWYVWDSARGITASTDPYLLLNSTAAEVTTTNWVDTDSTGFKLTAAGGNLANTNGTSYIFLSIA